MTLGKFVATCARAWPPWSQEGDGETSPQSLEFGWWEALGMRATGRGGGAAVRNRYKYVLSGV